MDLIIISGFSGAGKSVAVDALEDIDYYCIDNIPPALIGDFVKLCSQNTEINKVAVVADTRGGAFFDGMQNAIKTLKYSGVEFKVLFLEASDDVLVTRYKETRRKHPLLEEANYSVEEAVHRERELLKPIREASDFIIDTSLLSASQLRERTKNLFLNNLTLGLNIHCMSFGFKYGPATEADLVFDVRCLPNPYYIEELKHKTGLDKDVHDYVMAFDDSKTLLDKLTDMLDFLLPLYEKEGKSQLVLAFGCTGGKHRSVTFAEEMYRHFNSDRKNVTISHRDINK